jgi:hypothetical protein
VEGKAANSSTPLHPGWYHYLGCCPWEATQNATDHINTCAEGNLLLQKKITRIIASTQRKEYVETYLRNSTSFQWVFIGSNNSYNWKHRNVLNKLRKMWSRN